MITEPKRYNIYIDYKGYQIDPGSYRVFPAPLMGTKFATGRTAYSNLDFWQVGALTDFTHGLNQKFLVDPSQYYMSEGINVSKEGELNLERDLETQAFPAGVGYVTARYRARDKLYLGTSTGKVVVTSNGTHFTTEQDTGTGKIYGFFELKGEDQPEKLIACKGAEASWCKIDSNWVTLAAVTTGTATFTKDSTLVTLAGGKWNETVIGRRISLTGGTKYVIESRSNSTKIVLSEPFTGNTKSAAYEIEAVIDLYWTMVESNYAFGMFNDGIRQSTNGTSWIPYPPDPLWELPLSEGVALNAQPIQRGFLIGAERGLWVFIGGGSAVNLWLFPEFASPNNFRGMDKFGIYGVFSIEGQGLFYTDGAGVFPTNLNWQEEPLSITSCKSILTSGWDMFALVSDGTDWYLARCNMINIKAPKYWWIVKKLSKEPQSLSTFNKNSVYIHYLDGTCKKYDKLEGPYQSTGYITTPLIDENMILLQKLYKAVSFIASRFPRKTSVDLGYRLNDFDAFTSETTTSDGSKLYGDFSLPNPTKDNRIQVKMTLNTTRTDESPVVTDLCWKYILERPTEEITRKKAFNFTLLAEDELEKLDGDGEELGLSLPRSRSDILTDLWATRDKQEILNYVGADNELRDAFVIRYKGAGSSCIMKIDNTNEQITFTVDDVLNQTIDCTNKKVREIVTEINALGDYAAKIETGLDQEPDGKDLFPVADVETKGGAQVYYGTDIHSVIFNPQAPGQYKLALEGRGSDRVQLSFREA